MKARIIVIILVGIMLESCAGGTRGTGALIDRKLVDTRDKPSAIKKEPPLFNKWFGWACGDEDLDGEDDCEY